ncbi:SsgA family sporulation/cell division regulator [Streptomyces sp. NPDC047042]|uniref:SsgA family sporulation/cell division regulator n=1 Tax=Streptomyces sp. NPDC047042 TaxID=3154807 RepID=UPI0033DD3A34
MELHSGTVTRAVRAHVRPLNRPPLPLPAELRYRVTDPHAVGMSLGPLIGPRIPWVFARDLLAGGLRRPTGSGDVRGCPRTATTRTPSASSSGTGRVRP